MGSLVLTEAKSSRFGTETKMVSKIFRSDRDCPGFRRTTCEGRGPNFLFIFPTCGRFSPNNFIFPACGKLGPKIIRTNKNYGLFSGRGHTLCLGGVTWCRTLDVTLEISLAEGTGATMVRVAPVVYQAKTARLARIVGLAAA